MPTVFYQCLQWKPPHLCLGSTSQLSTAFSWGPPNKPKWFQFALTERWYEAAVFLDRAACSTLTAYHTELFGAAHGMKLQSLLICPTVSSTSQSTPRVRWCDPELWGQDGSAFLAWITGRLMTLESTWQSALHSQCSRDVRQQSLTLCLPCKAPTPSPPMQGKSVYRAQHIRIDQLFVFLASLLS